MSGKANQTLERLKEKFRSDLKDNQTLKRCYYPTQDILSGKIGIPVIIEYEHKAQSGRVSLKKKEVLLLPAFDPFSGEPMVNSQ